METLEFAKGHGTGNDFVIVPDPEGAWDLTPGQVAALCDRRFGIGGDGLLRVVRGSALAETASGAVARERSGAPAPEWFMDYHNADGSVAEMCGNGLRVFIRYLLDAGLVDGPDVTVLTRSGPVAATADDEAVTVALDRPRIYGQSTARVGGLELVGVAVDCGNPHLVCRLPADPALADLDLTTAPIVDTDFFPAGVNVEFIAEEPAGPVRMRVFERGVGETLSCGSGACAVAAVALRETGHGTVTVDVPGGRLTVTLTDRSCALRGPAVLVARGTVDLSRLTAARAAAATAVV